MANVNVSVEGTLIDSAGAAIGSAVVKAQRVDPDTLMATTLNADDTIEATTNASTGIFTLTLTGNSAFGVTYKISLPDQRYFYLPIPANAKATGLAKLVSGKSPAKSVKDITAQIVPNLKWVGQDLASASALPEPTCDIHAVTGTTAITSITDTNFPIGKEVTLVFASTPTLTDGGNIKAAGNLVATADDSWTAKFDGTSFIETSRAVN